MFMRKLFLTISLIVLISAGCNFNSKENIATDAISNDTQWYTNQQYGFKFLKPSNWSPETSLMIKEPLNGYRFDNPPAGTSFVYNATSKSWKGTAYPGSVEEEFDEGVNQAGVKYFRFGHADGIGGSFGVLIPNFEKNSMISIFQSWGSCIEESTCVEDPNPEETAKKTITDILETFEFTK